MKISSKKDLSKLNFTDFNVLNISIDDVLKSICFELTGAWILMHDKRTALGGGFLKITQYDSIKITSYDAQKGVEKELSKDNFEILRELCEIDIHANKLSIKGFAIKTGNWVEYHIIGGEITGRF